MARSRRRSSGVLTVAEYKATQTEAEFQRGVIQYARLRSWEVTHITPAKWVAGKGLIPDRAQRGFPDLLFTRAVRPGRPYGVVWAELKTETGSESDGQPEWRQRLLAAGQQAYLWRPTSWAEIERVLA